ncbi:hypothetical protein CBER1_05407 [Cercospora berteroae]|uniref:Uncharacterized protein n=1 Tax=Cercospora berteroae TaxID=357750 RepID=A0A2S6C635_9PEZI|nr:hypothetical protein CBER1_05407 [Cercospora berteroae]
MPPEANAASVPRAGRPPATKDEINKIRQTLCRKSGLTAGSDFTTTKKPDEPYARAGEELRMWQHDFSTARGQREVPDAFSLVEFTFPAEFGMNFTTKAEVLADYQMDNQFSHLPNEASKITRLHPPGRRHIMSRMIVEQARLMKETPDLRTMATEDIEIGQADPQALGAHGG